MKLIMIEWTDSAFYQGWHDKSYCKDHKVSKITSVGILAHEDSIKRTIVQSVSDKCDAGDGITIPKCATRRVRYLGVK